MATTLPTSNESFLPWLDLILGSIDKTVDANREKQDRAVVNQWAEGGYQGAMPSLNSRWGRQMNDQWSGQQLAQAQQGKDVKSLEDWLNFNQAAQGSQNWLANTSDFLNMPEMQSQSQAPTIGQTPLPTMQSPLGNKLASAYLSNQLTRQLPLTPMEQANLENQRAQTGLYGAQTLNLLHPPMKPTDTMVVTQKKGDEWHSVIVDKVTGEEIQDLGPATPKEVGANDEWTAPFARPGDTGSVRYQKNLKTGEIRLVPEPPSVPVERDLHDAALRAGLKPGTAEYRDYVKGPATPSVSNQLGSDMQAIKTRMDAMRAAGYAEDSPAMQALQSRYDEVARLSTPLTQVNTGVHLLPQSAMNELNQLDELKYDIGRGKATWRPGYTGPANGSLGYLRELAGTASPSEVNFRQAIKSLNDISYAKSGKTLSQREVQMFNQRLPQLWNAGSTFKSRMDGFENLIDEMKAIRLDNYRRFGYAVPDNTTGATSEAPGNLTYLRPTQSSPKAPALRPVPEGMVRMKDPDGVIVDVPQNQVESSLAHDWKRWQ